MLDDRVRGTRSPHLSRRYTGLRGINLLTSSSNCSSLSTYILLIDMEINPDQGDVAVPPVQKQILQPVMSFVLLPLLSLYF
jgi:hypothetical protein